jgi:hypothetical protein
MKREDTKIINLFGVPKVLIDLLVQSKISLQDLMLVFWDVTSCSLATVTDMLQPCSALVKLFKGRYIVSTSWEPMQSYIASYP